MKLSRTQRVGFVIAFVLVAAAAGAAGWWHHSLMPKRFGVVVTGRLYRSGAVTPAHLERLHREFGVARVISLLDGDALVSRAEHDAAERLGIEWHNVPLRGDGSSSAADRERILAILGEPNAPPTLVHCAAGTNRTGLAVGLYRLHCQQWSLERVLEEMRAYDFANWPKHENLRQALAAEAEAAGGGHVKADAATAPSSGS